MATIVKLSLKEKIKIISLKFRCEKSLAREQEITQEIQFDWQLQKQRQRYTEKGNKMEKNLHQISDIRYQIGVDFTAISSASVLDRLTFTRPLCLNF